MKKWQERKSLFGNAPGSDDDLSMKDMNSSNLQNVQSNQPDAIVEEPYFSHHSSKQHNLNWDKPHKKLVQFTK